MGDDAGAGEQATTGLWRVLFLAVLALWLVWPVVRGDAVAQDALPLHVAGDLLDESPGLVYLPDGGDLYHPHPEFEARLCEGVPAGTDCDAVAVGFVSTPLALGLVRGLGALPVGTGVVVLRALAAACLVAGMALLWRALVPRVPGAAPALAVSAVLLTPMATVPIDLGQTAPLLFLSALLPPDGRGRGEREALWVVGIALKGFTAVAGALLLVERRWRPLLRAAAATAVLAVAALLVAPAALWGDFVRAAGDLAETAGANPYNGSLEAALEQGADLGSGAASAVALGARALLVVAAVLVLRRVADAPTRWALAMAASVLLVPQVWWHYLWLVVAAVGVAAAAPGADRRGVLALPAVSLVLGALSVPYADGSSWPVLQLAVLLAGLALAAVVALSSTPRPVEVPS